MKHFLFFIVLVISFPVMGQTIGKYRVISEGYGRHSDNASCDTKLKVEIRFTDNSKENVVYLGWFPEGRNFDIEGEFEFSSKKVISGFYFYSQRSWSNFFGCRSPKKGSHTKSISYPYNDVIFNSSETNYNSCDGGLWYDNIEVSVIPLLTILDPGADNNIPTISDLKTIQSHYGFHANEYKWYYSLGNDSSFSPASSLNGLYQKETNLKDILGTSINIDEYHGQHLYLKQSVYGHPSNVVSYIIQKPAPHIISATPTQTTCFDIDDGMVKLQFDRPLKAGELVSISLKNTTDDQDYSVSNISALNPDNTYTFTGLTIGDYKLKLSGFYNGFNTYTEGIQHSATFTIDPPDPVEFSATKVDVWCNGGTDGEIAITAIGGVGNYEYVLRPQGNTAENWQPFSAAAAHNSTGVTPGTYEILVRDGNGCYAKDVVTDGSGNIVGLGATVVKTIEITQPNAPVAITYPYSQEPTGHGLSNGQIVAQITGGTPLPGGAYHYTWTHQSGTVWTELTTQVTSDGYFITLNNAPAGIYTLTVTDAHYNNAANKEGCTLEASEFELTQPAPIEVVLTVHQEILCHAGNEFGNETDTAPADGQRDESQNGAIRATVTGGVPFTSGTPYIYTWKKQNTDGTWATLTNQTGNTATALSDGNYAFNVEDANGITLGIYQNNLLVEATDKTLYLNQPPKLELTLSTTPATCASGADGSIAATVTGGTPPYTYYWSNGETGNIATIQNLSPNNYLVQIIDSKGCQIQRSAEIAQPEGYYLETAEQVNPGCFGGKDGYINITVLGGSPPYTYQWNTGENSQDINGLEAGTYSVNVTDASGCMLQQQFIIENPDEITINLGENVTLCNGQSILLNASLEDIETVYQWTSDQGFSATNAQVEISQPGTYYVTATTSLGCIIEDEISIAVSNQNINSEFLLSSQAYVGEEVVLINVSNPKGGTTEWLTPSHITIKQQDDENITLKFDEAGTYKIGLRSTQGNCFEEYYKNIVVEQPSELPNPGNTKNPFIQEFALAPNPNDGNFQIKVTLSEASPISLRIFNLLGEPSVPAQTLSGSSEYTIAYSEHLPSGVYLIILETAKGTKIKKMISL